MDTAWRDQALCRTPRIKVGIPQARVEEILERAFLRREFEVAEIGLSPYLIALSRDAVTLSGLSLSHLSYCPGGDVKDLAL